MTRPVRYSVLDLAPILPGGSARDSFANTLDLAQHAERWGYTRFWLAEHHNIAGIASAATSVLIGHVAGGTERIRVGAGGIMLPNHAPLVIAEQFGTLESLYPGRIDLGLGRAPGGDAETARALRRYKESADRFPADLRELQGYFGPADATASVRAVPGQGLEVPIYLLGSSDFSARLAAKEGLPFAFASHFAPDFLETAIALYRGGFTPSAQLRSPYVMVGVNLFAADTDQEARRLFTTLQQAFLNLIRGVPGTLPPPVDTMDGRWNPSERAHVDHMTHYSVVGSAASIRRQLDAILEQTNADELIFTSQIHAHEARLHSFEIGAELMRQLNGHVPGTTSS